jgi:signal transduction histidine kinase
MSPGALAIGPGNTDALHVKSVAQFDLAVDAVLRMAGAADDEVDRVITETLASLAVSSGAERAYVTQFHTDRTFRNSHEWTESDVVPQAPAIQNLSVSLFPYSHELAAAGELLNVGHLDELPSQGARERDSFGSFGVAAVLQVPILVDGGLVGLVGLNRMTEGAWAERSIERLDLVGRAIGVALGRRAANERLRQALVEAEEASRAKDDLVARAGHELRTPLHAILGFAELLDHDGVKADALRQITTNGKLLLTMIDDLLALGRPSGEPGESAAVGDLLNRVFVSLESVADHRRVSLRTESIYDDPLTDTATPVRQVLHCVASTALTVAGPGGKITAAVTSDNPPVVTFLCRGAAVQQPTGLALALARSFVELLGGDITVSTEADAILIDVRLGLAN